MDGQVALSQTLRRLKHNPSTYIDSIARYLQPAQDLTGQITKDALYYFAYGGNADIWEGRWTQKHSGRIVKVAVKVLKGHHGPSKCKQLLQELSVWSAVQHEHIIPFLGVTFAFDRPNTPCLVSPYYQHGDITGYVKEQPNVNKLALLAQIASALSHLHSLSIIHGDLKGSNILIDDGGKARLADFGLARFLQTSGYTRSRPSGTVRWMALELFAASAAGEEQSDPQVTMEADVWAFGLTGIEIFDNNVPFSYIKRDIDVMLHILSGGRPDRARYLDVGDDLWRMLEMCWHKEPNQRPLMRTIFSILSHRNAEVSA